VDFKPRASFILPTPNINDSFLEHLAFQLTDEKWDPKHKQTSILIVTLSKIRQNRSDDLTCVLEIGEHSFMTRKSYISYRHARTIPIARMRRLDTDGRIQPKEVIDEQLFTRICDGLQVSRHVKPITLKFFNKG